MNYANYPIPHWLSPYTWKKKPDWWKQTIIRDNYRCVDCFNGEKKLIVHHIDKTGSKKELQNNNLSNLTTLCKECHAKRHGLNPKFNPILSQLELYSPDKKIKRGTLQLIATKLGISRERVRQVAQRFNYESARNVYKKEMTVNCWVCEKEFIKTNGQKNNLCSNDCRKIHYEQKYWGIYPCEYCKFYFKSRKALQKLRKQRFCSKTCQGRWLGSNYGWKFGTNNYRRLYPETKQIKSDFSQGFTVMEFAEKYNYKSINGAYTAIKNLILKGEAENFRLKGLYRIKR